MFFAPYFFYFPQTFSVTKGLSDYFTNNMRESLSDVPLFVDVLQKLQGSGPLILTEEEKRTLVAEGYPVPIKLPLTKSEEKALKRVRRKIKNKISAQESRRKKKEYVECLEKKVENYTSENGDLWRKVENLETANRSLLQQLQKLQSLISGKVVPRSCKMASTQTGTCLMMVALCFVLVLGSLSPCVSPLSFLPHSSSSSSSSSSQPSSSGLTTVHQGGWCDLYSRATYICFFPLQYAVLAGATYSPENTVLLRYSFCNEENYKANRELIAKWPQLEERVCKWLLEQRAAGRGLSTVQLRLQAQVVAKAGATYTPK
uniref:BZIP domain-containing protein n=1 Tax=Neogobius melanostomus TaxID=47308 RepID=A0A8C6V4K3_9GOBI